MTTRWRRTTEQPPVAASDLTDAQPIDGRIGEEVQHGQKINEIELDVQHGIWHGVDGDLRSEKVKYHVGQPEDEEGTSEQ